MSRELDITIMEQYDAERKAKAYSKSVARKAKREREKRNLTLSIIGGAFLSLPVLYGMLFVITLV